MNYENQEFNLIQIPQIPMF